MSRCHHAYHPLYLKSSPALFFFFLAILFILSTSSYSQSGEQNGKPDGFILNKGSKFGGLTFSLSSREAENDNQLFVYYENQSKSNWTGRIDGGYFFKKNLALGGYFAYSQNNENSTLIQSDGTKTYLKSFGNEYAFAPFLKYYIPLDKGNRFYIFNQLEAAYLYGSGIKEETTNDILTRTYTTKNSFAINLRPGILVFPIKSFAVETSVGVLGMSSSVEKSKTTNLPDAKVKKNNLTLDINVLNLFLGFYLYF